MEIKSYIGVRETSERRGEKRTLLMFFSVILSSPYGYFQERYVHR